MAESVEFLQAYRNHMDMPVEMLASTLGEMGMESEGLSDYEVVEIATRKLRTLHGMVLASKISPELLKVIMAE